MKSKLLTIAVVVLALFSVFSFVKDLGDDRKIENLASAVESKTNKTIVYNGKDGANGKDGVDGINAVSYSITELTIKEVPLMGEMGPVGPQGEQGLPGPKMYIQNNSDTGDIEVRYENQRFWSVLVPCVEIKLECPSGD